MADYSWYYIFSVVTSNITKFSLIEVFYEFTNGFNSFAGKPDNGTNQPDYPEPDIFKQVGPIDGKHDGQGNESDN